MRPRDIRRQNLELLVKQFGTIAEVARRGNTSEKYLSQVLTKRVQRNSERSIGDVVAVRLESGCNKPPGWIDIDHTAITDRPAKEPSSDPNLYLQTLSRDEEVVLKAFRMFSADLRKSWLVTARDYLASSDKATINKAA